MDFARSLTITNSQARCGEGVEEVELSVIARSGEHINACDALETQIGEIHLHPGVKVSA